MTSGHVKERSAWAGDRALSVAVEHTSYQGKEFCIPSLDVWVSSRQRHYHYATATSNIDTFWDKIFYDADGPVPVLFNLLQGQSNLYCGSCSTLYEM